MNDLAVSILRTDAGWAGPILRLALGIMLLPHGAQKLLGWFGGYGFSGTMGYFTATMRMPWILALIVILTEFFGSLFLIAGAGVRFWSLLIAIIMSAAAILAHRQHGFFMNWFGNQSGEGVEFFILAVGIALTLLVGGAGRVSVDALFVHRN
ncbi:MAG: DoxX family protein [Leptospirales bacterium]|nr:DoxX family protein [Leptospirales bacterium]